MTVKVHVLRNAETMLMPTLGRSIKLQLKKLNVETLKIHPEFFSFAPNLYVLPACFYHFYHFHYLWT